MRIALLIVMVLFITSCVSTIPDDSTDTPNAPDDPSIVTPGDDPSDDPAEEPADAPDEALPLGSFRGAYYASDDFTDLFEERIDETIDFAWGQNAPIDGMPADHFSVRWEGRFLFEEDDYTFTMRTDDGMRIMLDGEVILESWKNQPPTDYSTTIAVEAGEHVVRVDYYEAYSTANAQMSWVRGTPDAEDDLTGPQDPIIDDPIERPPSDGVYGARFVPASRDVTIATNRRTGDVFVSPGGDGDCSFGDPCSLASGIGRGGHVWMMSGTYRPSSSITLSGITLESVDPNEKAIIDFRRIGNNRVWLLDGNVVRNIIVRNSGHSGIYVRGSSNLVEGVISEYNFYNGFQVFPTSEYSDLTDPDGASYNTFRDSIGRYNNDDCCAISCGAATCSDSDADGFGLSAGAHNTIEHCEAYGNTDDGFDIWRSYASTVRNSIAYGNGYDNGARRGNGNGFKMGSSSGPDPNDHLVENNWAYGNAAYAFINNGGDGTTWGPLVCGESKETCKPVTW